MASIFQLCHHMEGGEPTAFTTLSLQLQIGETRVNSIIGSLVR